MATMDTTKKKEFSNWKISKILKWINIRSLDGKERVFFINEIGKYPNLVQSEDYGRNKEKLVRGGFIYHQKISI